jgi:hypothetical protein
MKNIQLFSPRNALMGAYSFEDIPNIRIQLANHMMFCKFNEMEDMKQVVVQFDPRVSKIYNDLSEHFISLQAYQHDCLFCTPFSDFLSATGAWYICGEGVKMQKQE